MFALILLRLGHLPFPYDGRTSGTTTREAILVIIVLRSLWQTWVRVDLSQNRFHDLSTLSFLDVMQLVV